MGPVAFFFGFLAVGLFGADIMARLEPVPAERFGALATLGLLCLAAASLSTTCYTASTQGFRRRSNWFVGLLGGVIAAVVFLAATIPIRWLHSGYSLALALMPTILASLLWSFLGAKVPVLPNAD